MRPHATHSLAGWLVDIDAVEQRLEGRIVDFDMARRRARRLRDLERAAVEPLSSRPAGCPAGPSQIRTCRFPASGSSGHGLAARFDAVCCLVAASGSGYLFSRRAMRSQFRRERCDRLASARHHDMVTLYRNILRAT